ncbi:hypothetical protein [Muricomes intestini]|uniref:hypothetical protein n=1 Tax=Muricomes intestini TaxID=1796634 RepID=UPI0026BEC7CD
MVLIIHHLQIQTRTMAVLQTQGITLHLFHEIMQMSDLRQANTRCKDTVNIITRKKV